jgi:hypothetical protein
MWAGLFLLDEGNWGGETWGETQGLEGTCSASQKRTTMEVVVRFH